MRPRRPRPAQGRSRGTLPPSGKVLSRREFLKGTAALGILSGAGGLGLPACETETRFTPPRPPGLDAVQHHTTYELQRFTDWLEEFGKRGFIGEMNWPNGLGRDFPDDQAKWNALGELWYTRADAAKLWVTAFCADERQVYGGFWLSIYSSVGERGGDGEHIRAHRASPKTRPR